MRREDAAGECAAEDLLKLAVHAADAQLFKRHLLGLKQIGRHGGALVDNLDAAAAARLEDEGCLGHQ